MDYPMASSTRTGCAVSFTFIVRPFFLNYYPALYFLDKPDPLGLPAFARSWRRWPGGGVAGRARVSGALACATIKHWHIGQQT